MALQAAPVDAPKPPNAEDIAKAKKIVEEDERLKDRGAIIGAIDDPVVGKALPEHVYVTVIFRQFPVARRLPEGLSGANVFAVDRDGKVTVLKDAKELKKFVIAHSRTAKEDEQLKDAARAWVRLASVLHQDGFYRFKPMDDATKVAEEDGARTATATVVVMAGGSGTLTGKLTFDADGKVKDATEEAKIRPGPRPICQATKLLDPDPIVRRMAEQDLLCMGTAAKAYLDEQRAKAPPELQRAIDRLWQQIVAEEPK
jgi:hypothetical protein